MSLSDLKNDLIEMLRIPSESGNTRRFGEFLVGRLRKMGFKARLDGYGNVVAKRGMPRVLVLSHIDTVPGKIPVREAGGRVYGRGACDTKGSWAALLEACANSGSGILIIGTCDEETQSGGIRFALGNSLRRIGGASPCFAIVMEPSKLRIIDYQRGYMGMRLVAKGRKAHASLGKLRDNAIAKMLRAIARIEGMKRRRNGFVEERFTVTKIRGGETSNVLPDFCEATVDCRLVEAPEKTFRRISNVVRRAVSCERLEGALAPIELPVRERIAKKLAKAVWSVTGRCRYGAFSGATEASALMERRIPCVIFGPGAEEQAHSEREYTEIAQVNRAAGILKKFFDEVG